MSSSTDAVDSTNNVVGFLPVDNNSSMAGEKQLSKNENTASQDLLQTSSSTPSLLNKRNTIDTTSEISKSADTIQLSQNSTTFDTLNILEEMIVYPSGHSVLRLSEKHRILLIVIKWFGCPMCQHVISEISNYLSSFLIMNIVPVICHQENLEKSNKCMKGTQLLHCRVSNQIKHGLLMVPRAGLLKHAKALPTILKFMFRENRKFRLPAMSDLTQMDIFSLFTMHIVRHGSFETSYFYKDLSERPDYGKFIFNLGNNNGLSTTTITNSSDISPEVYLHDLKKLFPDMFFIFQTARKRRNVSNSGGGGENDEAASSDDHRVSIASGNDSEKLTVFEVLENSTMRRYFKAFLSNIFSLELVIFIEEIAQYKILCKKFAMYNSDSSQQKNLSNSSSSNSLIYHQEACVDIGIFIPPSEMIMPEHQVVSNYIFETFLEDESVFEVNTSKRLINATRKRLEEEGHVEDLFDALESDVISSMLYPLFLQFENTDLFREMIDTVQSIKQL